MSRNKTYYIVNSRYPAFWARTAKGARRAKARIGRRPNCGRVQITREHFTPSGVYIAGWR